MLKKLFTLILFVFAQFASAEYNGWFIKFSLETTSNEIIIGHIYRASAYFDEDSLENQTYTTRALGGTDSDAPNAAFMYFKNRMAYTPTPNDSSNTGRIYTLIDEQRIPITEIKSIRILEMIDFSYMYGISSSHELVDSVWMKKPPVKSAIANGYLCSWDVYIHEQTEKTDLVLAELKANEKKNKKRLAELEEDLEYADYKMQLEIESQIDELQDKLDEMTSDTLAKLDGEKVVIISFCSC